MKTSFRTNFLTGFIGAMAACFALIMLTPNLVIPTFSQAALSAFLGGWFYGLGNGAVHEFVKIPTFLSRVISGAVVMLVAVLFSIAAGTFAGFSALSVIVIVVTILATAGATSLVAWSGFV